MLKHVTVSLVLCCLALLPVDIRAQEAPVPDDVSYTIVDTDIVPGTKRGLDVRINRRVSEDVLRSIAHELKSQDSREFDRTLITYYLPNMEVGSGAWASTHFDPELEVSILGLTKEEAEAMSSENSGDEEREIIGRWLDDSPGLGSRLVLFREEDTLYMEQTFNDGSSRVMEVVEKESPHGRRFEKDTSTSDYWLIDEEGNLQIRDDVGLISTAEKIE